MPKPATCILRGGMSIRGLTTTVLGGILAYQLYGIVASAIGFCRDGASVGDALSRASGRFLYRMAVRADKTQRFLSTACTSLLGDGFKPAMAIDERNQHNLVPADVQSAIKDILDMQRVTATPGVLYLWNAPGSVLRHIGAGEGDERTGVVFHRTVTTRFLEMALLWAPFLGKYTCPTSKEVLYFTDPELVLRGDFSTLVAARRSESESPRPEVFAVYTPTSEATSEELGFTLVDECEWSVSMSDPAGPDRRVVLTPSAFHPVQMAALLAEKIEVARFLPDATPELRKTKIEQLDKLCALFRGIMDYQVGSVAFNPVTGEMVTRDYSFQDVPKGGLKSLIYTQVQVLFTQASRLKQIRD